MGLQGRDVPTVRMPGGIQTVLDGAMTGRSLPLIALIVSLAPGSALAQEWQPVAPGVEHASWVDGGSKVLVTRVDLCAPGIRMRATAPGEGPRTVSSFGEMVGAAVAINGDWWSNDGEQHLPDTYPRGLALGNGNHFPGTVDRPFYGVVAFGPSIALHSVMEEDLGGPHFWMQEAVSGQPTLVWNGQVRDNPADHCGATRARTSVGFDESMSTMYLAVVEEVNGSPGKTCNQMAAFMQSLGAHSALNQDGGGSSTMWLAGSGVVNSPTDGQQRSLVNHWAVKASGWGPPHSCPTRDIPPPDVGRRRLVSSEAMDGWGFAGSDVGFMSAENLDAYPEGSALPVQPRYLQHSDASLWLVDESQRRHVASFYAIATWRIDVDAVEKQADAELDPMPTGPSITETPILVLGPDLTVWLIDKQPSTGDDSDDPSNPDAGGNDDDASDASSGCQTAGQSTQGTALLCLIVWIAILRRRSTGHFRP